MWDENSVYPETTKGYPFTVGMTDHIVEKLDAQLLTKLSAILKVLQKFVSDIFFQLLHVKAKVKTAKISRMRNGYFTDTLTSVKLKKCIN